MPAATYTITASLQGNPRKATRCNPTSAMCLAYDWMEDGCSDIRITNCDGVSQPANSFRANLPLRKRLDQRFRETRGL